MEKNFLRVMQIIYNHVLFSYSFIFSIKTNRFVDRRLRRWNVCTGVTARTINCELIRNGLVPVHARPAVTVILFFENRL